MMLMDFQEREAELSVVDVFYLYKIMSEEKIHVPELQYYHDINNHNAFVTCIMYLQEKYPYFRIRPSRNEDYGLFILTISLPKRLKHSYRQVKTMFEDVFDTVDTFYGEIILDWHYNELHVKHEGIAYYHEMLKKIIKELKLIKKMEEKS